jgi:hypothetical protein
MTLHPLSNCGITKMKGKFVFKILNLNEEYVMTIPNVGVRGLFFGTAIMENMGTSEVTCEKTGYSCSFKWKNDVNLKLNLKRVLSGKINYKNENLYKITGNYCDTLQMKNIKKKKTIPFMTFKSLSYNTKIVRDINDQDKNESRVVWFEVAKNLDEKNHDEATKKKNLIEESQRENKKKKKKEKNEDHFTPVHFKIIDFDNLEFQYINFDDSPLKKDE